MNFDELHSAVLQSRESAIDRVYEVGQETPLESMDIPEGRVLIKREDVSPINSYKWRGAYNKLKQCVAEGNQGPFVATSAGNHAQGVALASAKLNVNTTLFMPRTTPKLKRASVLRIGQANVDVRLEGDNFEQASRVASEFANVNGSTIIKPFDDVHIIAGQSTVADELARQQDQLDFVYVPVGGGGLASGVCLAMASLSPTTRVVGVEVRGQESMSHSISLGKVSRLEEVDIFCDGTAVAQPGELTFEICQQLIDRIEIVTNEQVCAAIQKLWEEKRVITEPSGAIALAGLMQDSDQGKVSPVEQRCCAVLSGANTDFLTLPMIVGKSQLAQPSRCYYRFEIAERKGALIELLDLLFEDVNIVDFQYGKVGKDRAFPVLGLLATPSQQEELRKRIVSRGISAVDVSRHQSAQFRVIPFRPDLSQNALFLQVDFPDRPGALRELMREISDSTNICYFNFNDTGQTEGHALIGFEFSSELDRHDFERTMANLQFHFNRADMEVVLG